MFTSMEKQLFKIIVEQDEDGFFIASVPALPGCHTQAKSMSELRKRTREAIALCLEEAKRNVKYRQRIAHLSHEPSFVGLDMVEV